MTLETLFLEVLNSLGKPAMPSISSGRLIASQHSGYPVVWWMQRGDVLNKRLCLNIGFGLAVRWAQKSSHASSPGFR